MYNSQNSNYQNSTKGNYVSLNKNFRGQFLTDQIGDKMFTQNEDFKNDIRGNNGPHYNLI